MGPSSPLELTGLLHCTVFRTGEKTKLMNGRKISGIISFLANTFNYEQTKYSIFFLTLSLFSKTISIRQTYDYLTRDIRKYPLNSRFQE